MKAARAEATKRLIEQGKVRVRPAREQDRDQIMELAHRFHGELDMPHVPLNEDRMNAIFSRVASGDRTELGLVATLGPEEDAPVIGFLYAQGGNDLFMDIVVVTVVLLYVVPEHRLSVAAFLLMRSFMNRAINGGAEALSVHIATGIRTRESHRFLTRLGFGYRGGNYFMFIKKPGSAGTGAD